MSRVALGRVVQGRIVVDGEAEPLPEGRRVTLVIEDEEAGGFRLDEQSRKELLEAIDEIQRGEFVTEEQMEAELDALK